MEVDKDAIIDWLANGETGLSSKTIAFTALGKDYGDFSYPRDPADLNRCIKLVEEVPSAKEAFPYLATRCERWKGIVDNWENLKAMFIEEVGFDWCNAKSAPKTYDKMQEILYPKKAD